VKYLDIVVNTGAFGVAGVGIPDVSYFSRFWVWEMKRPPRKLATKIFEIYALILGVSLKVYLSVQKVRISFTIDEVTMCILLHNSLYQVSHCAVFMEHLKLRKHKMAECLLMDHHRVPTRFKLNRKKDKNILRVLQHLCHISFSKTIMSKDKVFTLCAVFLCTYFFV